MSGVRILYRALDEFGSAHPGGMSFSIGMDQGGSSIDAVAALHTLTRKNAGSLWLVHNPQGNPRPTFHPKVWLFSSDNGERLLLLGSGNFTQGGLYTNYEASLAVTAQARAKVIEEADAFFDRVTDPDQPDVVRATDSILQTLHDDGHLPSEGTLRRISSASNSFKAPNEHGTSHPPLFEGRKLPEPTYRPIVHIPKPSIRIRDSRSVVPKPASERDALQVSSLAVPKHRYFYITVQLAKKTEIFLAKTPLDEDPAFFGAPFRGLTTPKSSRGMPQPQADPPPVVRITLHADPEIVINDHPLKMWTYSNGTSANGDFRTNFTAALQKKTPEDSVVRFERDPLESPGLQYAIDIFPPYHPQYGAMRDKCDRPLANSTRSYGWA